MLKNYISDITFSSKQQVLRIDVLSNGGEKFLSGLFVEGRRYENHSGRVKWVVGEQGCHNGHFWMKSSFQTTFSSVRPRPRLPVDAVFTCGRF